MIKKEKKKSVGRIAATVAGILAAGCLAAAVIHFMPTGKKMTAEDYFGPLEEGELAISLEKKTASERAIWIDDRIYVDYTLVQRNLNSRFFWDDSCDRLLFTTADEVWEIDPDSTFYRKGQTEQDAGYVILRTDGEQKYLDLEFLKEHSDLTSEYASEPERLCFSMGDVSVREAPLKKNVSVRYQGGIKSPIITKAKKNTVVTVLEQYEKWSRIRTPDGYFGYVRNNTLGELTESVRPSVYDETGYTSLSVDGTLNLIWHQIDYADMNGNFASDTAYMSGVNVISPTWYFLSDNEGGVGSFAWESYVKEAHKAGLQVWPLIRNFGNGVSTTEVLASRSAREKVQQYLISEAKKYSFDGINIDFEGILESDGYAYVQFMRELSILCRKEKLILSVDVPVPMDYSYYYNRKELGKICDYVIMMGYDEHYAGSDLVGSVASLEFERTGIRNMLLEVPKEKIVSAIPFYCRLWFTATQEDGTTKVTSEARGMASAWNVLEENGVQAVYDSDAEQPYGEWIDAQGRLCQIWLEDDATVASRASLVREHEIGGIAAWVLGNEMDYVWRVISDNIR